MTASYLIPISTSQDSNVLTLLSCKVINAYSDALFAAVPDAVTTLPTGSAFFSIFGKATYSAPNPPTITNAPNNVSALPVCAVSFYRRQARFEVHDTNHLFLASLRLRRCRDSQL